MERVEIDRILYYLDTLVSPQILLLLFSRVCSHELSLLSGGFTRSQVSKAVNILNMVLSCELSYVQLGYNVLLFNQLGNALRRQRQSKGTLRLNQVRVQECWHIPLSMSVQYTGRFCTSEYGRLVGLRAPLSVRA